MKHNPDKSTPVRNRLTLADFYSYRIACRYSYDPTTKIIANWSSLHLAGKLLQQYVLDAWIKVESNNLNYLLFHQPTLRVEMYSGLMDYVANQAQANNVAPGRVFILPSTFQVCFINYFNYQP